MKLEVGKKYINSCGHEVEFLKIDKGYAVFKGIHGCYEMDMYYVDKHYNPVVASRLPVVGEIWVGNINKLPYKILDIDDRQVYSRHKDVLCGDTIEVFLRNWSPPKAAPEEIYVNVYENTDQTPYTASFFTKEKAENFQAAKYFTIKETAVRYIRADTVSQ